MWIVHLIILSLAALAIWQRERIWAERMRTWTALLPSQTGTPSLSVVDDFRDRLLKMREDAEELAHETYLRRLFESLLNEIRQGVVIVDEEMRIQFANRTMAVLFHRELIHRNRYLLDELQDHHILETVRQALHTSQRCVRNIRHISGQLNAARYYLIEAAPLPSDTHRGAWLMAHDITEQVMTEQIRKDFVANASHELRTPLTLIQGYLEMLQAGLLDDPAATRRCVDIMEKHGKRLVRIIEDMLTISRLEQTAAALNIEPFSMRSCVEEAIEHLGLLTEQRSVQFSLDFPPDGGILHGDRFYWDQVFTNLLENALKENGGRDLTLRVSGRWEQESCTIEVADNGVGIAAHDVPFVFKRFYRGHKHHAQNIRGTGLGLSIVKRAVEAHGGEIHVRSVPGVETVFRMRLPIHAPEIKEVEPAAQAPLPIASSEQKVLLEHG